MLRPLRLKLSLAFMAATLGLVVLVGGSAYASLFDYFEKDVDLTLMHRMASQFQLFGFSVPEELVEAEAAWLAQQAGIGKLNSIAANPISVSEGDEPEEEEAGEDGEDGLSHLQHELLEAGYASDSILVFVLPLDENGSLLFNPNPYPLPMEPDLASSGAALANGSDLRFGNLPSGERVRILSYRTSPGENPAVLQVGRLLEDQDEVLAQLAASIGLAGILILVLVGAGSWWLAGRTLVPAQFAWDQQQTFVANASHELRTPLTLMRASTEVALRGDVGAEEAALLKDVLDETDYMGRLVGDLLLLSRLDAGRLQLELEAVSVDGFLEDIQQQGVKLLGADRVTIERDSSAAFVLADRVRLRQVLLILLDNAIKHNPIDSKVHLRSSVLDRQIEFSVEDRGPGIQANHLPHVFERFYQIEGGKEQVHNSGLGLSIAKGLIELHGGSIRVESKTERGTRFTISLPRAKSESAGRE